MESEQVVIEVDGREAGDLYRDVALVDVELDEELAAMFRIVVTIELQPDGTWSHVDDERFTPWREVTISAGFDDGTEPLMTGYVTHVRALFDADLSRARLELWGMDGTALMDRHDQLRDWPNRKDSDIAAEVFSSHGFATDVEDTTVVHDEAVSTIIQRETDIQFLRRLALRNGYECFVEDGVGHFHRPRIDGAPQPVLALHFGDQTNVGTFFVEVDALAEAGVGMFQVHRTDKEVLSSLVESGVQPALGARRGAALLPPGLPPARAFVGMNVATGAAEMEGLCRGLVHRGEWFVSGEGEVAGNAYADVLRPRRPVTLKGVGESYSGTYYVSHVTHTISPDGYTQRFRVKRNGLRPTGAEDFGGGGGLLGGL